jgi:hypothetical protein
MPFNSSMFDPAALNRAGDGATAYAPHQQDRGPLPEPSGVGGQPAQMGGAPAASGGPVASRRVVNGAWQPDPAVISLQGGVTAGRPAEPTRLRGSTHTAPGEPITEVLVPSIVKDTSGSETPLAQGRRVTRPAGRLRHPSNGQFVQVENVAAGHPSLRQSPMGDGPRSADRRVPVRDLTAPTGLGSPPNQVTSRIQHSLAEHLAEVGVQALPLREDASPQFENLGMTPPGQHLGQNPVDPGRFTL